MLKNENTYEKIVLREEEIIAEYAKKDITDDFIFGKVMQKQENCIELLERLTGNHIDGVSTIVSQRSVKATNDSKGVRYDIYVEDDKKRIYDAEMQNPGKYTDIEKLPRRTRFYQGMIDLNILESGADYKLLKESYVIFICTFDPFGRDLCLYEFENICKDEKDLSLGDGRKILIFNIKGHKINVDKEVADLISYMETKQATDEFTKRLEKDVSLARQNREWMVEYMKTLLHDMDVRNEGIAEGISIGREEGERIGRLEGIAGTINAGKSLGAGREQILSIIMEQFSIQEEEAKEYIERYW